MLTAIRYQLLNNHGKAYRAALVALLIFTSFMGLFAADMYAPALPAIANSFKASISQTQLTIAASILGLAIAQLCAGTVSDGIGRRPVVLTGLGISILGSLLCVFAPSIQLLLLGRFVQGLGFGTGMGLGRVMIRDIFSGKKMAQVASFFGLTFAVSPAIAPVVGGYLTHYLGWQSIFYVLAIYAMTAFILVGLLLPESNRAINIRKIHPKVIARHVTTLLQDRQFIGYSLCASMALGGLLVYFTISPFLMQTILGLTSVQYGWLALFISAGTIAGRMLNAYFLNRYTGHTLVLIGALMMSGAGISMLLLGWLGLFNIPVIMIPMMFYIFGTGFIIANAMTGALMPFPRFAGTAGSLYGCLQMVGIFIATSIASLVHTNNQEMLALLLTLLGSLALLGYRISKPANQGLAFVSQSVD